MTEHRSILLIEDNEELRENTAELLELSSYNVHTAENGKIGVRKAKEHQPDLIICDIMMPELDGFGVLFALSKDDDTASIPFIFLTAKSERESFRKGMNLGADDYIIKPFDEMELLDAVESRLKKADLLKRQNQAQIKSLDKALDNRLNLTDLTQLSEKAIKKNYKKKAIIYSEDTIPHVLYYLTKGKVKTFKMNEDGKEFITGLYREGDFFGYMDLLENTYYRSSAVALEDAEVSSIPKDEFFKLLYNSKDVAEKFIRLLSNQVSENEEQLLKLAYNSVRKRVAESLLLLHERYKQENEADGIFSMAISREDLANLAGTAKETVIRTLADFKAEGLITIQGSRIIVQDIRKLQMVRN